jgi:hypothetical protein
LASRPDVSGAAMPVAKRELGAGSRNSVAVWRLARREAGRLTRGGAADENRRGTERIIVEMKSKKVHVFVPTGLCFDALTRKRRGFRPVFVHFCPSSFVQRCRSRGGGGVEGR